MALIVRNVRPLKLTIEGEMVAEFAQQQLNHLEALRALNDGLVDFATIIQDDDHHLPSLPLENDRLVALVPVDSPLAKHQSLCAQDLPQENFIMTKGGSEKLVRTWYARNGCQPKVKHTAVQLTSILGMIRAGIGVSIIAEMAVPEFHPDVTVIALSPEQPRIICITKHDKGFNSHTPERVWKLLLRFNK